MTDAGETPALDRQPMSERACLASIEGTLADVLDAALSQTAKDLLDLQGIDRQDAETYLRVGRPVLLSLRQSVKALEREPGRILVPGGVRRG